MHSGMLSIGIVVSRPGYAQAHPTESASGPSLSLTLSLSLGLNNFILLSIYAHDQNALANAIITIANKFEPPITHTPHKVGNINDANLILGFVWHSY